MNLAQIRENNLHVAINAFDIELAKDIQNRLAVLGCLDPPADGVFGQISRLALREFARLVGVDFDDVVDANLAQILLNEVADSLFPLQLGDDFAGRILRYMKKKNFWFARMAGWLTIVYVEGADEDGTPNDDAFNKFNDRRIVLAIEGGRPKLLFNVLATTEPGKFFTFNPENPKGAARIAFGQHKAWSVGTHKAGKPGAHEALVQVAPLPVHRDFNKDGKRDGDLVDVGMFGINQHSGFNANPNDIGHASAGCLVSRLTNDHKVFMALVKTDPRFSASHAYRFMSTIIAGDDLQNEVG